MGRARLTKISAVCSTIAAALLISAWLLSTQISAQEAKAAPTTTPIYNPYPFGILPSDLTSELLRVQGEVAFIETEAINQWHAIPPPILTGNPVTLQNTGVPLIGILGKLMNFDLNISPFRNTACASCHMPYVAFSGPIPSVNLTMIAYPGSAHFRANKRTAQRYTYSNYFPPLQYDPTQGAFFGGNFWDSRATGYRLRSPDADQAQGPPVDPNGMGFRDTACITFRLSQAVYRPLFEEVWGQGSFAINFPSNTEQICSTPNGAAIFV